MGDLAFTPPGGVALFPAHQVVTAAGGILPSNATLLVQGDSGPVVITATPQISAGTSGQLLYLVGESDTNTVQIHDGDGVHLHHGSSVILTDHDYLVLQFHAHESVWIEVASNFTTSIVSWPFSSPAGSSGTYYVGGFYMFGGTSFTPAGGTTLGTVNTAYHAHAFIVLGAASTDMVVRVTGTSVDELGGRVPSDTEDLDTSGGSLNDYFETVKKWVGQISFSLLTGTGVAVNDGLCKYWDNQNSDFRVTGVEVTGTAGANDSTPDFLVHHHRPTGWTYNVGAAPSPPPPLADMQSDYVTEFEFTIGQHFAWKRVDLSTTIFGSQDEGIISEIVTGSNKSIESLNWVYTVRPN